MNVNVFTLFSPFCQEDGATQHQSGRGQIRFWKERQKAKGQVEPQGQKAGSEETAQVFV